MAHRLHFDDPYCKLPTKGPSRENSEGHGWFWIVTHWPSLAPLRTPDLPWPERNQLGKKGEVLSTTLSISLRVWITAGFPCLALVSIIDIKNVRRKCCLLASCSALRVLRPIHLVFIFRMKVIVQTLRRRLLSGQASLYITYYRLRNILPLQTLFLFICLLSLEGQFSLHIFRRYWKKDKAS